MWKIIILSISVVTSGKDTNIDIFKGEWTPVAFYPAVVYFQACLHVAFTVSQDNNPCICADRNYTELIHSSRVVDGTSVEWGRATFPFIAIRDDHEVSSVLNVNCTCGDKEYSSRVVGRPVGDNYYVLYKTQSVTDKEPNSAVIYARDVPAYAALIDVMHNVEDLKNRDGEVMCTSEYVYAEMLSKMKIRQ